MITLKNRLIAVIKMLEHQQVIKYSATVNLILSYLYDIRDNKVPEQTLRYLMK